MELQSLSYVAVSFRIFSNAQCPRTKNEADAASLHTTILQLKNRIIYGESRIPELFQKSKVRYLSLDMVKKEKRHAYAVGLTNSSHSKCMTLFDWIAGAGSEPTTFGL